MKSDRKPRELPSSSSFSTPHVQSLAGARFLLRLLEEQTATVVARAADFHAAGQHEDLAYLDGALERQALSEAVQVLSAMAVEGAVNFLGVLVLGGEAFYRALERKPVQKKLRETLTTLGWTKEPEYSELMSLVDSLSQARNSFVHPKPQEGVPPAREGRGPTFANARQSVAEAMRVLQLLQSVSHVYRLFFHVW
jgi:hypothetical protein